jgi:DNA polymerase-3 subunit epsilon
VVFDTEATGLDAKGEDSLVSISAVRMKNGRIDLSDIFHELVNPNRDIPPHTVILHEIRPQMVAEKPPLEKVLPHFMDYIGSSVLIAHHARVDMSFLNREMIRLYGFPILNMVLDTVLINQMLVLKKTRVSDRKKIKIESSLNALAERYSVIPEGRHSSLGDALTTAQIFQKMLREIQNGGMLTLKDLVKGVFYTGTHASPYDH